MDFPILHQNMQTYGPADSLQAAFSQTSQNEQYVHSASAKWLLATPLASPPKTAVASSTRTGGAFVWIEEEEKSRTLLGYNGPNEMHVTIAGTEPVIVVSTLDRLRARYPQEKEQEGTRLVNFWSARPNGGADQRQRRIDVADWKDIKSNYTQQVTGELEALMEKRDWDLQQGQFILWQGLPGTGKTYGLRALANEWRDWASVHYITDPENFFGSQTSYMTEVLLSEDDEDADKWKLLILEDVGELISVDAKRHVGQALSRFLNTVDGFIGQGLKLLVLVTTNEEISELHPAVIRPGRCAAQTVFEAFTSTEAEEWLAARQRQESINGKQTIADLYARLCGTVGREPVKARLAVGFGA